MSRARTDVRTVVSVDGVPTSTKKLQDVQKQLELLGGGHKSWIDSMKASGPGIGAAVLAIGAIAKAAQAAAQVINQLAQGFYNLAMRGGEVSAVATAFERLASPETLRGMRDATGGLLDNMTLMQEYNQIYRNNLIDENLIDEFLGRVARAAQETGENTATMIIAASNALSGGGLEVFQRLGVNIASVRQRVIQSGLSMESMAGRSRSLELVLEELRTTTNNVDNSSGNLNDGFTTLNTTWSNFRDEMARSVSESPAAVSAIDGIREGFESFLTDVPQTAQVFAEIIGESFFFIMDQGARLLLWLTTQSFRAIETLRDMATGVRDVLASVGIDARGITQAIEDMNNVLTVQINAMRAIATGHATMIARRNILETAPEQTGPPGRTTRVTGRNGSNDSGLASTDVDQQIASIQNQLTDSQSAEDWLTRMDTNLQLLQQGIARVGTDIDEFEEKRQDWQEAEQLRLERRNELEERRIELLAEQKEQEEIVRRAQVESIKRGVDNFSTYAQGVNSVGSTIASVFGHLAESHEEGSKAAERYAKIQGGILAGISFVMAAIELAASIKSFASQEYASGALHLASMASYIVAGGLALANLGGNAKQGSTSGTVGSFTKQETNREPEKQDDSIGGAINIFTLSYQQGRLGRELNDASYRSQRSGIGNYMQPAGAYY